MNRCLCRMPDRVSCWPWFSGFSLQWLWSTPGFSQSPGRMPFVSRACSGAGSKYGFCIGPDRNPFSAVPTVCSVGIRVPGRARGGSPSHDFSGDLYCSPSGCVWPGRDTHEKLPTVFRGHIDSGNHALFLVAQCATGAESVCRCLVCPGDFLLVQCDGPSCIRQGRRLPGNQILVCAFRFVPFRCGVDPAGIFVVCPDSCGINGLETGG